MLCVLPPPGFGILDQACECGRSKRAGLESWWGASVLSRGVFFESICKFTTPALVSFSKYLRRNRARDDAVDAQVIVIGADMYVTVVKGLWSTKRLITSSCTYRVIPFSPGPIANTRVDISSSTDNLGEGVGMGWETAYIVTAAPFAAAQVRGC
ncbi:hypothetical protein GALMADRAFT_1234475 [Galerina marginata CBS 339.88]|uniref:Uncharacterized protein n=1 Tax=Galerina marginata (strain CBS 339.88) TaxID=685588 RepID=A0A067T871_GALM3|nr:hypothetical protein GALMADRAFT_1234475 [Galerina marginata CBS 339.88]